MKTPNRDYLLNEIEELRKLLTDFHPGLSTWAEAYAFRMKNLMDFWQGVPSAHYDQFIARPNSNYVYGIFPGHTLARVYRFRERSTPELWSCFSNGWVESGEFQTVAELREAKDFWYATTPDEAAKEIAEQTAQFEAMKASTL
jgi:hypothetical protein